MTADEHARRAISILETLERTEADAEHAEVILCNVQLAQAHALASLALTIPLALVVVASGGRARSDDVDDRAAGFR